MSEFSLPNVVVLHDGSRDPSLIAIMAGLEPPIAIDGFTAQGKDPNPLSADIGVFASRADHLIYDEELAACSNEDLRIAMTSLAIMSHPRTYHVFSGEEIVDTWQVPPVTPRESDRRATLRGIINTEIYFGKGVGEPGRYKSPEMEP